ncbi:MAG: hypothetical protein CSA66_07365 [Proteobacteria bacterium]|nr:MAG: hypothetical protein CSA66_07365 [Pseudomonadota bacterium]
MSCGGEGKCVEVDGAATCECNAGFVAVGATCVEDTCADLACVRGTCEVGADGAYCECETGFAGELCDACADGFRPEGDRCVERAGACDPDPCVGGTCTDVEGVATCECDPRYTGELCDQCASGYVLELGACVPEGPPCNEITFSYSAPSATTVWVTGTFTGWASTPDAGAIVMTEGGGTWTATTTFDYGSRHLYKFIVDGDTWRHDPDNPTTEDDGFGGVNSVLQVCEGGCDPDPCLTNDPCGDHGICACDFGTGEAACACALGWAGDTCESCAAGFEAEGDRCVPASVGLCGDVTAFDWRDTVMYFVFVDRFYDSDGQAYEVDGAHVMDGQGASAQYEGGDFNGVKASLPYLADLGVSAIWLTAPFDGRDTTGPGIGDNIDYSGYHGYWPSPANIDYSDPDSPSPTPKVEPRYSTDNDPATAAAELHALIAAAHETVGANGFGMKVLFDYVMNHVDINSGLYQDHHDWFTERADGNGIPLCGPNNWWDDPYWGTRCAFTKYLPAFDFWKDEPRAWSVNDAVWWAKTFALDGYRLDAIKHVPKQWLTEVRARLSAELPSPAGGRFYLVGETFDYYNKDAIKAFVHPDTMLDGQFDFPFKKEVCESVFGHESMASLAEWMDGNDGYYDIDGATKRSLMTTWIGNHDIPRAIHFASRQIANCTQGSGDGNGWTTHYNQPTDAAPYERLGVAFAVMFTGPGIPLIYYGDEIGLAGGGDPDNRRMMPWADNELNEHQRALRDNVKKLANIRAQYKALSRGHRTTLSKGEATWVYRMGGCGAGVPEVVVALNRGDSQANVDLPPGSYTDLIGERPVGDGSLSVPARGFRVLRVD